MCEKPHILNLMRQIAFPNDRGYRRESFWAQWMGLIFQVVPATGGRFFFKAGFRMFYNLFRLLFLGPPGPLPVGGGILEWVKKAVYVLGIRVCIWSMEDTPVSSMDRGVWEQILQKHVS